MPKINQILGSLPSGSFTELDDGQMLKKLRDNYLDNTLENRRRRRTRERLDLYNEEGDGQIMNMLDSLFTNSDVRKLRKKFIELGSYQNLTRRIVTEISTVYSESAKRKVKNGNDSYKQFQAELEIDRVLREANRMVNLCNDCLIMFNVRHGHAKLSIVTPDNFYAVCHPNDATLLVAVILDQPGGYQVVTDDESFLLDDKYQMVPNSRKPLNLDRMPMVLVNRTVRKNSLLDAKSGADILAAHKSIHLINIMLLKHQKSGSKQVIAAGDTSSMSRSNPLDPEFVMLAPDGVSFTVLDLEASPDNYIKASRSIMKQIAANYGIPESVFDLSYQATSGYEIELKRTGLRELRRAQILDWRPVERRLASIMSEVLAKTEDGDVKAKFSFSMEGWGVNFGETEIPKDPMQMLMYMEKQRQMGLMSTVQMMMHLNPEMSEKEAESQILLNAWVEATRIDAFRRLNVSSTKSANEQIHNSPNSEENPTAGVKPDENSSLKTEEVETNDS